MRRHARAAVVSPCLVCAALLPPAGAPGPPALRGQHSRPGVRLRYADNSAALERAAHREVPP